MPIGRNLPIGIKFTIGFYAVIAIMLGLVTFGYLRVQSMKNNSQQIVETASQIDATMEMRLAVASDLQAVTLLINARSLEQIENAWALHQAHVLGFNRFASALLNGSMTAEGMIFKTRKPEIRNEVEKSILFHATEFQARIKNIHEVMRGVAELNQWDMDPERRLRPIYREVNEEGQQLQSMIAKIEKDLRAELKQAHEDHNTLAATFASRAVPGMLLAVVFSLGFGFFVSSIMLRHISRMVRVADQVAAGELPETVEYSSNDEIGRLARSLNAMVASSRSIVEQANQIAAGNYATVVTPRSDKDTLAASLNHMTTKLRLMTEATDRQQWFQGRLAELNETIRGEQDPAALATHVLNHLAATLGIQLGALYTPDDESTLRIIGSYALPETARQSARFRVGEGLVGQVALSRKHLCVQNVPEDYFRMTSALGSRTPTTLLVFPLLHDLQVVGVIELGTFAPFDDLKISFLERACRDIAVAISSAEHREQMKVLLEQTRHQAEELQIRQEELRQTNEELEEQTAALRTSEERLQLQQEELRVVNEELEERNRTLEAQRDAIRKKNDELRHAHEEIAKKAKALDTASRYKSEFLANMSHELRTPLNSILILSRLLGENREGTLTAKQLEFARTIHSSGTDLMALINEVLDLSKIEAGKTEIQIESVLLDEVFENLERTFQPVATQKGLSFRVERDPDLPQRIETDRQRFQQILSNLLSNAFKFTERGGVSVRAGRPAPGIVSPEIGLDPGSTLSVSVTDTGIGIPEDKQSLIFEAFQQADGTTSRQYGGTGLGLSISRELARLLGGEIALESRPGSGSTFVLYLPMEGKPPATAIQPAPPLKEPSSRPVRPEPVQTQSKPSGIETVRDDRLNIRPEDKSLLIIEDDPTFSHVLVNLARERGFKCLVAGDGETGLHFADYYRPKAIILDVGLPQMDGWTVMERLKENPVTRHIPVHFMSGFAKASEALRLGAIGFLSKPVDLEQIDAAFTRIETMISKPVKKLLIVEDDEVQRRSIMELIGNGDVRSVAASSGGEALALLENEEFDCMILDLGLKDMSGMDLLTQIRTRKDLNRIPVVIYTGRDLTPEENAELEKFADSIIVKGARSPQRLLDETTLFLHRVEADLPQEKQRMIRMLHHQDAPLSGKKILLVDDDMRNVFALSHVLEEQGMKVVMGKNGREGLRRLEEHPDVDLIIMDIMMPEMNGYEAMEAIRKMPRHADLPIIVLTAKAMKGDRARCIEHGASDYLAKPVDTDRLLSLLKVWLYGKGRA